jgi:hypothetical protein
MSYSPHVLPLKSIFYFFARVQTSDCRPESSWAEFGVEVAIKKFDKAQFYDKVNKYKFFTEVEKKDESENLCRKAFSKECEMLSRLVYKHKYITIS